MKRIALMFLVGLAATALAFGISSQTTAHRASENCAFNDVADDDGDTLVNDGCPVVGTQQEDFQQCNNTWDDDGDTVANDGCGGVGDPPAAGPIGQPEVTRTCSNATDDDDMDGMINDGCPQVGNTSEAPGGCADNVNSDPADDTRINDGCPAVNSPQAGDASEGAAGGVPGDTNQCDEPVGSVVDNDNDGGGPWPKTQFNDGCPSPVGGEQALPDVAGNADSGGSSLPYAAIAGAAMGLVVIGAGGWYARRRWLS